MTDEELQALTTSLRLHGVSQKAIKCRTRSRMSAFGKMIAHDIAVMVMANSALDRGDRHWSAKYINDWWEKL